MSAISRAVMFTACALAVAVPARAQDRGFGVKGGVTFASQQNSGASSETLDTRTGIVAGGVVILPFGSRLSLQAEGLYAAKGGRLRVSGIDSTLQVDYLEVPVLARVRLGGGSRHYYVAGGAAPALRLRARARTAFSGAVEEIDVADQVERVDLGVAMGGGAVFGRIDVDARYTHGVRDVDADTTDAVRTKNRALAVTAAVRF